MYDRFDQKLDVGVNLRMSEINALLSYAVLLETEEIIKNKYEIANRYIDVCDKYDWRYINPTSSDQRSNLYKFILLSNSEDYEKKFLNITIRTSPVYDYSLGRDPFELIKRHIYLPIWYLLDHNVVDDVIAELKIAN